MRKLSQRSEIIKDFTNYLIKEAEGISSWQEARYQYIKKCNPGLDDKTAYGLAGQQYHLVHDNKSLSPYEKAKYHWPRNKGKYEEKAPGTGYQYRIKSKVKKRKKKYTDRVKKDLEKKTKKKKKAMRSSFRPLSQYAN